MLSASTCLSGETVSDCRLELDLKPGLTPEKLDERLLRDFSENQNRDFINSLDALLPQKMIPVVVERSGIPERVKVNSITREQRRRLLEVIKRFSIRLTGLRPMEEAGRWELSESRGLWSLEREDLHGTVELCAAAGE